MIARLQYISQEPHLSSIFSACEAGCQWIQLRAKNLKEDEYLMLATEVKKITNRFSSKLIINDNLEVALKVGAYGVHLGKKDMDLAEARKIVGNKLIIGGSTNSLEDIVAGASNGADYLGIGPYRFTTTKSDLNPVLGLEGIQDIVSEVIKKNIKVPLIAIGGIRAEDVPALRKAGIYGVAVSGTITAATDKKAVREEIEKYLN